jgi:hypothetical protein
METAAAFEQAAENPMLVSYRGLRRAIGAIGIALPIALVVVDNLLYRIIERQDNAAFIRESISSYYWSVAAGGVFIGSLCSIGVFLWSYRGNGKYDDMAGNAACIAAVCTAMFPNSSPTSVVHYISAAILFLLLAYFCLYSFPGQDPGTTPTPKKPLRNNIYRTCGTLILLSIVSAATLQLIYRPDSPPWSLVFWFESLAIWSFGWSWYIKGKGLSVVQD